MNCRCNSILLCIPESWGMKCKRIVDSHMTRKWLSLDVPISLKVGPFLPSVMNIELIFEWTSDLTSSLEKPSYWKALSFQVVSNLHSFTSSLNIFYTDENVNIVFKDFRNLESMCLFFQFRLHDSYFKF